MNAAKCCANSGVLFDKGDATVKIAAAEQDVIEQGGHLFLSENDEGGGGFRRER